MKKKLFFLITFTTSLLLFSCVQKPGKFEQKNTKSKIDWHQQMTYQRGIEAVNWSIPAVSMLCMRDANFSLGGTYNTVYWLSKIPTAQQEALTANNQTPYANIHIDTKNGPVILDIPPASAKTALFGSAVDIWQEPIADIGPAGIDAGKGGKYVFLPPGYDGDEIEGCINIPSSSFEVFVALRCIPLGETTFTEAAEYAKKINAYSLDQINNPPKGDYIDVSGKHLPTLPKYDFSYFNYIKELIDTEPLLERDRLMGGMLASMGIAKGKAFNPDETTKKTLEKAVADAYDYLEYTFESPGYSLEKQWNDREWMAVREPAKEGFVFDEGDYLLVDERAAIFHWATFVPRHLGKATAYLMELRDADGNLLKGNKDYKLEVPAVVPARDFWSVIAYSKKTKAFIYNDLERVGLSSYDKQNMKINDDGTVDLYFSKFAPEGLESNWIPTNGEDFFLIFRFYGPQESYYDKSFKLPDVELIK